MEHWGFSIEGKEVDHRNRNKLDFQRGNLRVATRAESCRNTSLRKDNTTGYRGVSFYARLGIYRATIFLGQRQVTLGKFPDPVDAAKCYDAAARLYFGEFAVLNFPDS
jgi:hypothetical protein